MVARDCCRNANARCQSREPRRVRSSAAAEGGIRVGYSVCRNGTPIGGGNNRQVVAPPELLGVMASQSTKTAALYSGDSQAPAPQCESCPDASQ